MLVSMLMIQTARQPANQARWELQQALAIAETNFDLERKIFGKLARAEKVKGAVR